MQQAVVETLEDRRLLSAVTFVDGVMVLEGDPASNDRIVVQISDRGQLIWGLINNTGRAVPAERVEQIEIRVLPGQDRVRVHPSVTVPVRIVVVDPDAPQTPQPLPQTPADGYTSIPIGSGGTGSLPIDSGNFEIPVPVIQLSGGAALPGQAVHVSALESQISTGTLLTATYQWDFGNPGGGYNQLGGWTAAHVYDKPGTYTITLTVRDEAGNAASTSTQFTVNADTRRTIYVAASGKNNNDGLSPKSPVTLPRAMELAGDDTRILLKRGDVYTVNSTMVLPWSNLTIGTYGNGAKPLLVTAGQITFFSGTGSSRNITIQDLRFDTLNAPAWGSINVTAIRPQGEHFVIRDNVFLNVGDAVNANARPRYLLVQDNSAPLDNGLRSYLVWGEGRDHVYLGNYVRNSTDEHPIRVGAAGVQRLLVAHNDLRNPGKTSLRLTMVADAWVEQNTFHHSVEIGGVPAPSTENNERADRVVFIDNTLYNELRVDHGAHDVLVRGNLIHRDGATAITVRLSDSRWPHRSLSGLRIENNIARSDTAQGGFMQVSGRSVGAIAFVNNIYIAPNLLVGGIGEPALLRVLDTDLRSFVRIDGNIWPAAQTVNWVNGGLFFVSSTIFDGAPAYKNLQWWNSQQQVGQDLLAAA